MQIYLLTLRFILYVARITQYGITGCCHDHNKCNGIAFTPPPVDLVQIGDITVHTDMAFISK